MTWLRIFTSVWQANRLVNFTHFIATELIFLKSHHHCTLAHFAPPPHSLGQSGVASADHEQGLDLVWGQSWVSFICEAHNLPMIWALLAVLTIVANTSEILDVLSVLELEVHFSHACDYEAHHWFMQKIRPTWYWNAWICCVVVGTCHLALGQHTHVIWSLELNLVFVLCCMCVNIWSSHQRTVHSWGHQWSTR